MDPHVPNSKEKPTRAHMDPHVPNNKVYILNEIGQGVSSTIFGWIAGRASVILGYLMSSDCNGADDGNM